MRLVALYIEDHFLFEKPQTINFGGKYFYTFIDATTIIREENPKYIDNFYSDKTIELVSAIVGKNGSGKTSMLKVIIESLHNRLLSFSNFSAIFEDGKQIYISPTDLYHRKRYDTTFDYKPFSLKSQTLYYSPFLDFKGPP